MRKKAPYNLKSRIKSALRKLWLWSPMRRDALGRARIKKGVYVCENTDCKRTLSRQETKVDHITPVVPTTGFDDWHSIINRMFCPPSGLKVLCESCHKIKTSEENKARRKK